MAFTQAELREQLTKQPTTSFTGDNASYPFWNLEYGQSCTVRFLPDGDDTNGFFWRQKDTIKIPFSRVIEGGQEYAKDVIVQVPCLTQWGEKDPILQHCSPWWKEPDKIDLARTYKKRRSYIFQGFVVSSDYSEPNPPENPIRRFIVYPSLYEVIEQSVSNPELEDLVVDPVGGRDFRISITKRDKWKNYSTSKFSLRTRALSEGEQGAITQYGLFRLEDYLGKKPDADRRAATLQLFHDSLDGKPFDQDAYDFRASNGFAADEDVSAVVETVAADVSAPEKKGEPAGKPSAQEILERIRMRTGANAN